MIDAVIRTGGKQFRVHEGSVLNVPTMDAEPGSRVELRDVLLVSNGGNVTVGTPAVDGAVVVAEVVEHGRGKKVVSFKYKAKVRYRRKRGHRQGFTTLSIREITAGGVTVTASTPVRRARPEPEPVAAGLDMSARPAGFAGRVEETPVAEAAAEETETPVAETEETPAAEAEATPAPRTRRRRAAAESTETSEESSE